MWGGAISFYALSYRKLVQSLIYEAFASVCTPRSSLLAMPDTDLTSRLVPSIDEDHSTRSPQPTRVARVEVEAPGEIDRHDEVGLDYFVVTKPIPHALAMIGDAPVQTSWYRARRALRPREPCAPVFSLYHSPICLPRGGSISERRRHRAP